MLAAAAAAAGPRNRGVITPPNDRPMPGVAAAPAGASPGHASQPIRARAGAAPANQRPLSHSQPGRAGGSTAAGRSWARKRGAVARPCQSCSALACAPEPASRKRRPRVLPRRSRFTVRCNGLRLCAVGPRDGHFFSTHRQAPTVCKEREGAGPGLGSQLGIALSSWGLFTLGQLIELSGVQRFRAPCVHLLCASLCCAPGRRNAQTPGAPALLMERTLN